MNGGPEASGWARKHSFPDLLRTLVRYLSLGREGLFMVLFQVPFSASDKMENTVLLLLLSRAVPHQMQVLLFGAFPRVLQLPR